jgi:hypothetical protein
MGRHFAWRVNIWCRHYNLASPSEICTIKLSKNRRKDSNIHHSSQFCVLNMSLMLVVKLDIEEDLQAWWIPSSYTIKEKNKARAQFVTLNISVSDHFKKISLNRSKHNIGPYPLMFFQDYRSPTKNQNMRSQAVDHFELFPSE